MNTLLQVANYKLLLSSCYSRLHIIVGDIEEVPQKNTAKMVLIYIIRP